MRLISIFTFLLFSISFFSQTNEELQTQIDGASGAQKAQYELQLAQKVLKSDPSEAFKLAKDALINSGGNEQLDGAANAIAAKSALALKKYDEVIQYGEQAAEIYKSSDQKNFAISKSCVADAYVKNDNKSKAIENYKASYSGYISAGDAKYAGYKASKVGELYNKQKDFEKAIEWYGKGAAEFSKSGNEKDEVQCLQTIGAIYSNYGDTKNASKSLTKALDVAKKHNLEGKISEIEKTISIVEENKEIKESSVTQYDQEEAESQEAYVANIEFQHSKSLAEIEQMSEEMQLAELKVKSAQDEANILLLTNEQLELKSDKLEAENKLVLLDKKKAEAESMQRKAELDAESANAKVLWLIIGGVALAAILLLIGILKGKKLNQNLRSKNIEIVAQKDEILKQNESIEESINYATRIQKALLPSTEGFINTYNNSFVFLKPKDKVSGDFFWYHKVGNELIVVAADCTGHGVPGAFMSIIFSTILDKLVVDNRSTKPNEILEMICALLTAKLQDRGVTDEEFKDGMDVAVVNWNVDNNAIQYSGARNPIYIVREGELTELKGTRRSVGVNNTELKPFELQTFEGKKGDKVYMFSDGFPDQKGGPKGKKFYYAPFKELLCSFSMNESKTSEKMLNTKYEEWKGNQDQFDDVMVVGMEL